MIADTDEICCGDLAKQWTVTQATVSHHLRILVESDLIAVRPSGQFHYYSIVPDTLRAYCRDLGQVAD